MTTTKLTPTNDFSILIATVNGSGSQSANMILAKALFRSGQHVGTKNIFPSNIAGLPTWFMIRVNTKGFVSRRLKHEIVVARNADTIQKDLNSVSNGGYFLYDSDLKLSSETLSSLSLRSDVTVWPLPFRELTEQASDSIKIRKVLSNIVYVGVLAELLELDDASLQSSLHDQFLGKESVVEVNKKAMAMGRDYVRQKLSASAFHFKTQKSRAHAKPLFIDGNSAAALGALTGGCTFFSWYPITPATSLAESFQEFASEAHPDTRAAVVQSEDELSAISMVLGAGWAGARAMTSTSGPGLSLMSEAAGLSYFSEIPAVIWDVQRAGPSTGLPTRTTQGDVSSASALSHGDTEHVVLMPATPKECFEFAELAFDLAEGLQTLVIVLSDLDLGMNSFMSDDFILPKTELRRGKVLSATDLKRTGTFARYRDIDGDGIPYRTLPGTPEPNAAYFTRGSSHTETAAYSEDGANFVDLLSRLKKKLKLNHHLLPTPEISGEPSTCDVSIVYFGSTEQAIPEICERLRERGVTTCAMRIRALPLGAEVDAFLRSSKKIVVIEQNRDGQMHKLLRAHCPDVASKMISALQFDGMPITTETILSLEGVWT